LDGNSDFWIKIFLGHKALKSFDNISRIGGVFKHFCSIAEDIYGVLFQPRTVKRERNNWWALQIKMAGEIFYSFSKLTKTITLAISCNGVSSIE
jgi:hypothetical protein